MASHYKASWHTYMYNVSRTQDWRTCSCIVEAHFTKCCLILHHLWWLCCQTSLCSWGMICNPEAVLSSTKRVIHAVGDGCLSLCPPVAGLAVEVWELIEQRLTLLGSSTTWRLIHCIWDKEYNYFVNVLRYGWKFWRGIYFGGLAVLRAIRQYFIHQNFTVCCHHYS